MGEILKHAIEIYEHQDTEAKELRRKASEQGGHHLTHLQELTLHHYDTLIADLHGEPIVLEADRTLFVERTKPQKPIQELDS